MILEYNYLYARQKLIGGNHSPVNNVLRLPSNKEIAIPYLLYIRMCSLNTIKKKSSKNELKFIHLMKLYFRYQQQSLVEAQLLV